MMLENDLRGALERQEFTLSYQPIVTAKDGSVQRAEALLRWNHPEFGVIFPGEFIPMAEEVGSIVQLGEWAFGCICDQILAWEKEGRPAITVSFNASPRQFSQPDFCDQLAAIIRKKGINSRLLQLEITESTAMQDMTDSSTKLSFLKEMGMEVSVDDFGTGHSSLSYLKQLPIDRIKIDKSFTKNCVHDKRDAALVRAIVSMGHSLGLQVCAEGVETKAQLEFLRGLGCESIQGFLFSKSLPSDAFMEWVEERTGEKRSFVRSRLSFFRGK